ncbi:MAG: lysophospholipid acyltransferase family protein [Selenomonadaceae bacterium]|nr:lysophospholipid acyltransferase family protein [Selenomonadaceae bacterium]
MEYRCLKLLSWLICLLPLKFCLALGRGLARLIWVFLPVKRKKLATENIRHCLKVSSQEAEHLARESTVQCGALFMEVLSFPKLKGHMANHVKVIGLEHLTQYKNSSKLGAVIMTCHSDNWELMGAAFAQNGIPLVGVAKKQKSEGADKFINEYRTLIGMHITYRSGVREMYKMLDAGHFIGLIMDQDVGRDDGVVVKFFNRATNFVTGAASMSRFRKVPIFPAFMHRNSDGTHTLEIFPPLQVERSSDKHADIKQMTQRLAALIEEHVRKYPAEWFWLHDRWKSMRVEFEPEEVAGFEKVLGIDSCRAGDSVRRGASD